MLKGNNQDAYGNSNYSMIICHKLLDQGSNPTISDLVNVMFLRKMLIKCYSYNSKTYILVKVMYYPEETHRQAGQSAWELGGHWVKK